MNNVFLRPPGLLAAAGFSFLEPGMKQQGAERDLGAARRRFLDHLAETGNVSAAARLAGVNRRSLYGWRKQDSDFAEAWNDAVIEAVDALEQEARRRAVDGVEQPLIHGGKFVRHEDGSIVTIRHYSDRLLEFLLKALRPERFRAESAGRRQNHDEAAREAATDGDGRIMGDDERAERVARLLDAARARGTGPVADGTGGDTGEGLDAPAGTAGAGL